MKSKIFENTVDNRAFVPKQEHGNKQYTVLKTQYAILSQIQRKEFAKNIASTSTNYKAKINFFLFPCSRTGMHTLICHNKIILSYVKSASLRINNPLFPRRSMGTRDTRGSHAGAWKQETRGVPTQERGNQNERNTTGSHARAWEPEFGTTLVPTLLRGNAYFAIFIPRRKHEVRDTGDSRRL